ncbi:MAG: hypothetical protein U0936_07205 [Planctomycetaceae bacterium]
MSTVTAMKLDACPESIVENSDQGWLGREPTLDEQEVVVWLRAQNRYESILHVGVGTSLLHSSFGSKVRQGLTRDGGEAAAARSAGLAVVVCNKYAVSSYCGRIVGPYDCIVDVNIRSYACCDKHFRDYMDYMYSLLSPDGVLVTSKLGLNYIHPTSIAQLQLLCPQWGVRCYRSVVVMRRQTWWYLRFLDLLRSRKLS